MRSGTNDNLTGNEMTDLEKKESSWEPAGNPKVLWVSLITFTYGFSVWAINSSLAPYLRDWYGYSASDVLLVAAMSPLFAVSVVKQMEQMSI